MIEERIIEGYTFDDLFLLPERSPILPSQVDLTTRLSRHITLNIPFVSAAMDTVTESRTAIAMAKEGGIGIIHRNMPPEQQAEEVKKVKKYESGMIIDPITVGPDDNIKKVLNIMEEKGISGVPVTKDGKLLGIITHRDIRFETNLSQKVSDVMTRNVVTVKEGVSLDKAKRILHQNRIEKLPVVDDQGRLKGLITIKDIQKAEKFPNAAKDKFGRLLVGAAVGTDPGFIERAGLLIEAGVDIIVIDTAHGHSEYVLKAVERFRKEFGNFELMAGNIATKEAAKDLIDRGVDAIKVGVGPGSICTTRIVTGVGVPQLSAISWVYSVAKEKDIPIVADGGIKYSGDVVKALAAGASTVMIGNLFAGTEESPGEVVLFQGRSYKIYRGMGSIGAMKKGSADRYFQQTKEPQKMVPEGIEGRVPYKGPISDSIYQLVGGLKSGMGYTGCKNLKELRTKTRFVRVTTAGLRESHVHDVIITKEAPNYRLE